MKRRPYDYRFFMVISMQTSSLHASPRRSNWSLRKLLGRVSKKGSARSIQSSNCAESAHPVISPNTQGLSSAQTDQVGGFLTDGVSDVKWFLLQTPSLLIAPTSESNSDQVPNLPAVNVRQTESRSIIVSLSIMY